MFEQADLLMGLCWLSEHIVEFGPHTMDMWLEKDITSSHSTTEAFVASHPRGIDLSVGTMTRIGRMTSSR